MKKMIKFMAVVSAVMVTLGVVRPVTSYAAGEAKINISEDVVMLDVGQTEVVTVDYDGLEGFGDIAVVSSDGAIAAAVVADEGKGKAQLAIAGNGVGTATIAVCSMSNIQIVDYVVVRSGMAAAGETINRIDGQALTTIYNDRVVHYGYILAGQNGAQLAVTDLSLERESGIDCLKVSGKLWVNDTKTPGMTAFYAEFYDAAGVLIKRQGVYTRDSQANRHMELKWYVPEECARIDLRVL